MRVIVHKNSETDGNQTVGRKRSNSPQQQQSSDLTTNNEVNREHIQSNTTNCNNQPNISTSHVQNNTCPKKTVCSTALVDEKKKSRKRTRYVFKSVPGKTIRARIVNIDKGGEKKLNKRYRIEPTRSCELEVKCTVGDGNCLFRSVSLQIYGDEAWHSEVRSRCMDYIEREQDHFRHFITENFKEYVQRKREMGCFGNNTEIQSMAEIYNRAIEVYEIEGESQSPTEKKRKTTTNSKTTTLNNNTQQRLNNSDAFRQQIHEQCLKLVSINIFHCNYNSDTSNPPIRLLYTNGNHYDAILDPYAATIGVGLGLPGLNPGALEKERMAKAKSLSLKDAEMNKSCSGRGTDLTQETIEKAVIAQSLIEYWDSQKKQKRQSANRPGSSSFDIESNDSYSNSMSRKMITSKKLETKHLIDQMNASKTNEVALREYPPSVEELLFNGFPPNQVFEAYKVFGNRFDDMLAYLMAQNCETVKSESNATEGASSSKDRTVTGSSSRMN